MDDHRSGRVADPDDTLCYGFTVVNETEWKEVGS